MNFPKLKTLLLIAGAVAALASCKDKEEDTEITPSLKGTLTFEIAQFIEPDQTIKMTPEGIEHPDGNGIGYYWKVTPGMDKADTVRLETGLAPDGKNSDGSFTYEFGDSLATYTVNCTGFAKGYSPKYATGYVTIVKQGLDGSITGTGIKAEDKHEPVDGIDYYYVEHNGLHWMRNNLANPSYGVPYANSAAMSNVFGRFYTYEEALTACPEGWSLPTDKEWRELAASLNKKAVAEEYSTIKSIARHLMADAKFNLETMWEYWPEVGEITNDGGMAMIPCGYADINGNQESTFRGIFEYAAFWTKDLVADEPDMAYYRYLICDQPDMFISKGDIKSFGANVRCVRKAK